MIPRFLHPRHRCLHPGPPDCWATDLAGQVGQYHPDQNHSIVRQTAVYWLIRPSRGFQRQNNSIYEIYNQTRI